MRGMGGGVGGGEGEELQQKAPTHGLERSPNQSSIRLAFIGHHTGLRQEITCRTVHSFSLANKAEMRKKRKSLKVGLIPPPAEAQQR